MDQLIEFSYQRLLSFDVVLNVSEIANAQKIADIADYSILLCNANVIPGKVTAYLVKRIHEPFLWKLRSVEGEYGQVHSLSRG